MASRRYVRRPLQRRVQKGTPSGRGEFPADVSNLRILRDGFVFDVRTGTFHRVSETAALILTELQQRIPINEIVTHYAARYEIPRAVAERDVELFLNDLSVVGLPMHGAAQVGIQ